MSEEVEAPTEVKKKPNSTISRYNYMRQAWRTDTPRQYLRDRDLLLDGASLQESAHDPLAPDPEGPERSSCAEFRRPENDHLAFRDAVEPSHKKRRQK